MFKTKDLQNVKIYGSFFIITKKIFIIKVSFFFIFILNFLIEKKFRKVKY